MEVVAQYRPRATDGEACRLDGA